MSYIVSARKYRPKTFEDVVGQEQITTTLKRSIETDHLAQAFLFCGPRGVGKTTCARIMAKAVNTGQTEKLDEIVEDFSFNIFELDAASNNKVDDMHQLIAQVRIPPQNGKYKIYIIDEVHMLSQAAFNAFLKTLEEPPPYAIFILATTEKHKILPTILSRCQIYDFKRISVVDIVKHLQNIAQEEGIVADESALHIVAEKADGALRDALSIFDRLVSFAGNNLTYEAAVSSLNVLDYDYFFRITESLMSSDLAAAMLLFDEILNNGFEGDHFINGLSNHFRNLLVCKDPRTLKLLELSESLKHRYFEQASISPQSFLINSLSLASDCDVNYAQSINKRLLVESTLMKMAFLSSLSDTEQLGNILAEKKNTPKQLIQKENIAFKKQEEKTIIKEVEVIQQEVIEDKKIETPFKKSSSISLNLDDLAKGLEEEEKNLEIKSAAIEQEVEVRGDLALNEDNLNLAWKDMLIHIQENISKSLFEIINDKQPTLKGNIIEIIADSSVEKTLILKEIQSITRFLKGSFKENNFEIDIPVEEDEKKQKVILNQKDKFQRMLEANPSLFKLKEDLDLELEL